MSQEALICGEVSYHDYNGILVDEGERDTLQRNLGPINKVRNLDKAHFRLKLLCSYTRAISSNNTDRHCLDITFKEMI